SDVFMLLYLHFQCDLFDSLDDIANILPDFDECMQRALFAKQKKKQQLDKTEPIWSEVLVELFLSLLVAKSRYTSNVVFVAFRHICPFLTATGIQSLTEAILNQNVLNGDNEEDEDEDEEMDAS